MQDKTTQLILGDFRNFVYYLWHQLGLPDPTDVQYDISEYLQSGPRRRMVKAFRGVGKSWLTAAYVLWKLLRNHNERILVVSASKDRADAFSVFVRRLIEEVPLLQILKPRDDQRDSVVSFDVGPSEAHQSPSVKSAGITGQITGSRATIIVADDIETPRNSLTQTLRDRLSEAVKEFDAILLPGGEIVYLGTDQTQMSLYGQLPSRGYEVKIWPARVPDVGKLGAYGDSLAPFIRQMVDVKKPNEPTDPNRFDEHDLVEREASYGRSGFAMQFMLDPTMGDTYRYPLRCSDMVILDVSHDSVPTKVTYGSDPKHQGLDDLECLGLSGDRFFRPIFTSQEWEEPTSRVMFVDPSGRGVDETGVAVVYNWGNLVFLAEVDGYSDGFTPSVLEAIAEMAARHKVHLVLCEPNYGGGMFNQLLGPYLNSAGHPCTIEDSKWAKGPKEWRIADTLEPVLNQHNLVVARSVIDSDLKSMYSRLSEVGESAGMNYSFIYQLTRLSRERGALRHDDRLEAVAGAVNYFVESAGISSGNMADRLEEMRAERVLQEYEQLLALGGPTSSSSVFNAAR